MTTLEVMLRVAVEASAVIAEVYETPFSVDFKAPEDPVTAADRRANTLICERLSKAFPGVPLVAEESEPETFAGYRTAERVFFVDPLDGTAEFVNRNGEFVVMIGKAEAPQTADVPIEVMIETLIGAGIERMEAIKTVARERGLSKREVYKLISGPRGPKPSR